jgi:hypothetical protein
VNRFSISPVWRLALIFVPVLQAKNVDEVRPAILVRLYNLAGVPNFTLHKAEDYATDIFKNSGIDILWRQIGTSTESDIRTPAMAEVMIVIRAHPTQPLSRNPDTMGNKRSNVLADVFYDRVQSFASNIALTASFPPLAEPAVLGHVIAHELGHVMFLSHSSVGIMRARWNANHIWRPGTVDLFFTEAESQRLRAELIRRSQK